MRRRYDGSNCVLEPRECFRKVYTPDQRLESLDTTLFVARLGY